MTQYIIKRLLLAIPVMLPNVTSEVRLTRHEFVLVEEDVVCQEPQASTRDVLLVDQRGQELHKFCPCGIGEVNDLILVGV